MKQLNKLTEKIIGLAIKVHKELGPGFVEKIYQRALKLELIENGFKVQDEFPIQIKWKNRTIGKQKLDLLINNQLVLELKAQNQIEPIHLQQLLSYLKAGNKPLGLVLNFGEKQLGIKRVILSQKAQKDHGKRKKDKNSNESQKTQKSRKKRRREMDNNALNINSAASVEPKASANSALNHRKRKKAAENAEKPSTDSELNINSAASVEPKASANFAIQKMESQKAQKDHGKRKRV